MKVVSASEPTERLRFLCGLSTLRVDCSDIVEQWDRDGASGESGIAFVEDGAGVALTVGSEIGMGTSNLGLGGVGDILDRWVEGFCCISNAAGLFLCMESTSCTSGWWGRAESGLSRLAGISLRRGDREEEAGGGQGLR